MRLLPWPCVLAALLAGCTDGGGGNAPGAEPPSGKAPVTETPRPALPSLAAPLSRRDLLLAVADAASDHASGRVDMVEQRAFDGRPFSVALRFCEGEPESGMFQSRFDADEGILRLSIRPDLDAATLETTDPPPFEAVEGFWLPRPWLLDAACPVSGARPTPSPEEGPPPRGLPPTPPASGAAASPIIGPRVGIAQFYDNTSDRGRRRDQRAYEVTRRLAEGSRPGAVDLVLEGRLRALPDGRTILCSGGSPASPPACIVSVAIDAVTLRQVGGEVLGTWASS